MAGRSIVSNAQGHVGRRHILNLDLLDFFPSINFGRARGVLLAKPFLCTEQVGTTIAQIACLDNALPVGAPTSPVIANMVAMKLDGDLMRLVRPLGAWYTRYADDLTISSNAPTFPSELATLDESRQLALGKLLVQAIEDNGFAVNSKKSRLQQVGRRQEVTGIVVNERLNVSRTYVRRIRAMLRSLEIEGLEGAQRKLDAVYSKDRHPGAHPEFLDVLRGRIAYVKMVRGADDPMAKRFETQLSNLLHGRERMANIPSGRPGKPPKGAQSVFLSYDHCDKDEVDSLEGALINAGLTVWRDVSSLWAGDDWRLKIKEAISNGSFAFVPCFSHEAVRRTSSGLFEELSIAAEEHRRRNPALPWIFTVRLEDVDPPHIDLGGGRSLHTFQWVDLFKDHKRELAKLVTALQRVVR